MEIRIYDPKLNLQGIIENQTSLIWTRRFFEPGEFELHVPITDYNVSLLKHENLVTMYGSDEAGVIEDLTLEEDSESNEITARGRFLSSYFDRRLIKETINVNMTYERAMRRLIEYCVPIPLVEFEPLKGIGGNVRFQATYKNLLTYLEKLSRAGNIGFRLRPDFNAKRLIFEVYEGVDRTFKQGVHNRVVFSEGYANLNNAKYQKNEQLHKNVAYVRGSDSNDKIYTEIVGDNSLAGLARRELYVNGFNVSDEDLTVTQFREALRQEGINELGQNISAESFECNTDPDANFKYREHYDLGDIVTAKKENWGITAELRITELQEIYEYGVMSVSPTLGDPLPTKIDWEDK